MLSDAWIVRSVVAVDDDREPIPGADEDVREFDDTKFECADCGASLPWSEVELEESAETNGSPPPP